MIFKSKITKIKIRPIPLFFLKMYPLVMVLNRHFALQILLLFGKKVAYQSSLKNA